MATNNINLLPSTYNIQKGLNDAVSIGKKVLIGGAFLLVFLASVCSLAIVFFTRQLNTQIQRNNQLKSGIAELEAVEQRYFLIKDRVGKISKVLSSRKLEPTIDQLAVFTDTLPENTTVSSAEVTSGTINIEFLVTSSQSVVQLMSQIISNDQYSQVSLKNFQFNPAKGYLISFEIQK
ncbi:MAG: hypothetical protein AAB546_01575 [Patescibacteria group bacterium]